MDRVSSLFFPQWWTLMATLRVHDGWCLTRSQVKFSLTVITVFK